MAPIWTGRLCAWLYVRPTGARSWVLRIVRDGKRSDIGVGSFPAITLAAARAKAVKLRTQVKEGADPLAEKRAAKAKRAQAGERTFEKANKLAAPGTTVHGWRSTFRDWAGEVATFPVHVIEAALAHAVGNATTQAYQRGDLFKKHCGLMDAWAAFLAPTTSDGVVDLASPKAKRAA